MPMIHELPAPVRGNTHAHITRRFDHPGSGMELWYWLGTVDAGGAFVPDPLIPEIRRLLRVDAADRVRQRAAQAGAPVTAGVQEYRAADVLAVVDTEGWDRR